MTKLVCIVGPTASGKSSLALRLAQQLRGEIISCDSMQIYRHMDIGTAKPTKDEQVLVRHHMLDIIDPGESYSAAQYACDAALCADDIASRGMTPIVAGGTGLYLDSLIGALSYEPEPDHTELRSLLNGQALEQGDAAMHARLAQIDPESAARIHENDRKRIIRALEIYLLTGETASARLKRAAAAPKRYRALKIGLVWPREELYRRIDMRVDQMFGEGLVEEARAVYERFPASTSGQAIGYKELFAFFEGRVTLEEAKENIARESRRYAKRQMSWFGRDGQIFFLDARDFDDLHKKAFCLARDFMFFW